MKQKNIWKLLVGLPLTITSIVLAGKHVTSAPPESVASLVSSWDTNTRDVAQEIEAVLQNCNEPEVLASALLAAVSNAEYWQDLRKTKPAALREGNLGNECSKGLGVVAKHCKKYVTLPATTKSPVRAAAVNLNLSEIEFVFPEGTWPETP